jgi:hypothetical protein
MVFVFPVLCVFLWMAWSVSRMSQLPAWRRRLPTVLVLAAVAWWIALVTSGPSAWWAVWPPICLGLASWAASLRERRLAGRPAEQTGPI